MKEKASFPSSLYIIMGRIFFLALALVCMSFAASARPSKVSTSRHYSVVQDPFHQSLHIGYADTLTRDTTKHWHRKHKLIAALLAVMPLGIFGLHRMYLGTSTGVPFLYIISFGGGFGILPWTDFVLILLCKDVNVYAHNPGVFMWTRKQQL